MKWLCGSCTSVFLEMENISYHVSAGHIDEDLLRKILKEILYICEGGNGYAEVGNEKRNNVAR